MAHVLTPRAGVGAAGGGRARHSHTARRSPFPLFSARNRAPTPRTQKQRAKTATAGPAGQSGSSGENRSGPAAAGLGWAGGLALRGRPPRGAAWRGGARTSPRQGRHRRAHAWSPHRVLSLLLLLLPKSAGSARRQANLGPAWAAPDRAWRGVATRRPCSVTDLNRYRVARAGPGRAGLGRGVVPVHRPNARGGGTSES